MSHYRDHLDAARARIETLEAKLKERDAALAARDAEIAEIRAEVERLRGGSGDDGPLDGPHGRAVGQRALLVALAVCGFATATGYAMVRPSHCPQRGAYPASVEVSPLAYEGLDPGASRVISEHLRLATDATAALERGGQRAQRCREPDGPSGEGTVTVTFLRSGRAEVSLDGTPYEGTEVGECVADAFRAAAARVRPFEPMTMKTLFSMSAAR
ncbi:MAG TPA: hypothetical protein VL242_09825 [Sorangium sp.]|uniref:hypothetical protein n=1 Tax=Sorangium sp. So ce1153 TaxID=3133333 RepID=UPI002C6FA9D6|nr:hypothetical protein [Sorangium sp.]